MNQKSLPQNIKDYSIETTRASIKVYLSILGPVGTAIDEILFGIGERVRGKRLEQFVKVLADQLNKINENKIDIAYFESENFYDLRNCFKT